MTNDEALIQGVLEGDRERYGALVEPYLDRLHAISYSYLGDAQAAEDVTQDALVKAFTSLHTLADPAKFGPWLRQITRNLSRSAARRRKFEIIDPEAHRDQVDRSVGDPGDQVQIKEAGELLERALARISPKISVTIVLFYLKHQSISEIADFLGISENTVKQRLHRGRGLLRDRLEEMVLKEKSRKVELSEDFLPGVMALLPSQPAAPSLLGGVVAKLAAFPLLWPLLSTLLVGAASAGATGWLLVSDVAPSNDRARRSLWVSTGVATVVVVGIILAVLLLVPAPGSPHYLLSLSLLFLLPLGFFAIYFCRAGATRSMKLSLLGCLAIAICLGCLSVFPQYALYLWPLLFLVFAASMMADAPWITALGRRPAEEAPVFAGDPPPAEPVSMAFLHENAGTFLKLLNQPFPLFHNIAKESDHVCFSAHPALVGKLIRRLSKLTERWSIPWCRIGFARLYPDGRVEYDVYSKDGFPAHWGTVEEEEARVGDYIETAWAHFTAGDEAGTRALTPDFFPEEIYPKQEGRSLLGFLYYVAVAIMAATAAYLLYLAF